MFYVGKREDNQKGLFTSERIERGEVFMDLLQGTITNIRTRTSVQIDDNTHVEHDAAQFINHSFTPNCTVLDAALVATSVIEANEELVFDYTMNEDDIYFSFTDKSTGKSVGT